MGEKRVADMSGGRAIDEFQALVDEKARQPGMTRERATSLVAKQNPELRQRVIDEANRDPAA